MNKRTLAFTLAMILVLIIILGFTVSCRKEAEAPINVDELSVQDSQQNVVDADIKYDENENLVVAPKDGPVKNIVFRNINKTASKTESMENIKNAENLENANISGISGTSGKIKLVLGVEGLDEKEYREKEFVKVFAIDPTQLAFESATVTLTATGTELYKCKEWNFSVQQCYGTWELFKTGLVPGREYNFTLTPDDPGFGEIIAVDAIHLDENYDFISNIYPQVSATDNVWSEQIFMGEIVRVSFAQNLSNGNFIDVVLRSNHTTAYFEVYEAGTNNKVGRSGTIDNPEMQYIEVKGLSGPTDTFDFKVVKMYPDPADDSPDIDPNVRSFLEFDYIHDAAVNATASDGIVVYGEANIASPRYRYWNSSSNNFTVEQSALSVGVDGTSDLTWVVTKASPRQDQILLGTIDKTNDVNIQVFHGTNNSWANLQEVSTDAPNSAYRAFHIGYEQVSARALIVYENSSVADSQIAYRIWNGTTYSAEVGVTLNITNAVNWIVLVPRSTTNEIMMLVHDSGTRLLAIPWNGTTFVTEQQRVLTDVSASATTFHFIFAWEEQSGEGRAGYGISTGNDIALRNYTRTAPFWSAGEEIIAISNSLKSLRMCPDKNSDYIGLIYQHQSNGVGVRMWNGTTNLASPPSEELTEPGGADNNNIDCAFHQDGNFALFGFIDNNQLLVDYFNFTKNNTWSVADLALSSSTATFATDDISGLRFTRHPTTDEVMIIAMDIAEDISTIRWTGGGFATITASPIETTTEVLNADQEGVQFEWFRFDPAPTVLNLTPIVNQQFSPNTVVNISANVTDNIGVSVVFANVTLPNGSTVQQVMLNTTRDTYNATFNITSLTGTYVIMVIANDTKNQVTDATRWNFSVAAADSAHPSVFDARPVANSTFNVSVGIEISANVTDDVAVGVVFANITMPNGTTIVLNLGNLSGNKYNSSFLIPNLTGRYNITYVANDTSNRINATVTSFFNAIDEVRPLVFDVRPVANSTFNVSIGIEIAANVTDNIAVGVVFANITMPNGTVVVLNLGNLSGNKYNSSFLIPNLTGQYNITYFANDTSNNQNATTTSFFNVVDEVRPLVFDVRPVANSTFNVSVGIEISANVTDNVAVGVVFANITFPNGTVYVLNLGNLSGNKYNSSFLIPNLTGQYNITFVANDSSNNVNATTTTFFVGADAVVPQVFDVRPVAGATFNVSTTIEIAANVTDNVAVGVVFANITFPNGTVYVLNLGNLSGNKYNSSFLIPNLTGQYNVTFVANDSSNNVNATTTTFFVSVDQVRPLVFDVRPVANSTFNVTTGIEIAANVTDNVAVGVVFANITFPNGTVYVLNLGNLSGNKYNSSFTIPNLVGQYNITFVANDTSNNVNATTTTFFVAVAIPQPSLAVDKSDSPDPVQNGSILNYTILINNTGNASALNITLIDTYPVNVTFVNATPNPDQNNNTWFLGNLTNVSIITVNITVRVNGSAANGSILVNFVNVTYNSSNDSFTTLEFENTTVIVADTTAPNVFDVRPVANSTFNVSIGIEISANVTDDVAVGVVFANITMPNGTVVVLNLGNLSGNKYNSSFLIPNLTGQYNITFFANDSSNNVNATTTTFFVSADVVVPLVFDVRPVANSTFNVSVGIEISANVTDNVGVSVVNANITFPNGTVYVLNLGNLSGNKYNSSFLIPNLTGQYNVTFVANDSSNNVNATTTTFFVSADVVVPLVFDVRPVANSTFNVSIGIEVAANVTDNVAVGVVFANITFPNGTVYVLNLGNLSGNKYNSSFLIPNLTGRYNITYFANDSSDNVNATTTSFFNVVDGFAPAVFDVRPVAGSSFNLLIGIEIAANVTDHTAVDVVRANVTFPNGTVEVVNLSLASGSKYNSTFTIPNLDGRYNVSFFANDTSGNVNTSVTTFFFTNDTVRPLVFDVRPVANSTFNVSVGIEVAANVTDNVNVETVFANITFPNGTVYVLNLGNLSGSKYNSTFLIPTNLTGQYNITYFANDSANNQNATTTSFFNVVDQVPPVVTNVTTEPSGPVINNSGVAQNVSVNFTVNEFPVNVTFRLFNASGQVENVTGPVQVNSSSELPLLYVVPGGLPDGVYVLNMTVTDSSNNSAEVFVSNVSVSVNPSVFDVRPVSNSTFNVSTTIEIAANVTDNGVVSTVFANITFPNGTVYVLNLGNLSGNKYNSSFLIPNLTGQYNVTFIANDSVNNVNATTTTFFVGADAVVPLVFDVRPLANATVNATFGIEISANVTDNVNVSTVVANITFPNGTVQQVTLSLASGNKYNATFVIPNLGGQYNVTFVANDTSNNVNATITTFFNAETPNFQPELTVSKSDSPDPVLNGTLLNYSILINSSGNDTALNVTLRETYPTNVTFVNATPDPDQNNDTWFLGNLTNGSATTVNITVRVNASASDNSTLTNVANVSFQNTTSTIFVIDQENTTVLTVGDTLAPNVVNLTPTEGSTFLLNDTVRISANVTDNVGVGSVTAFVIFPDGSNSSFTMSSVGGGIYEFNFTNLTLRGLYNITIIANDTTGNSNGTESTFFNRVTYNNRIFDLIDEFGNPIPYAEIVITNSSGILTINITLTNMSIQLITLFGHNESDPHSILIFANASNETARFSNAFAFDPSGVNFTSMNVTGTAQGNTLYKCINYSIANLSCIDGYEHLQNLTPGQNYTFSFNESDPGFGES
ncbi:DUF11 domain-containing protein, partial [Candidatus Woesearchaeota archaeon]|nr:DUF11 domain-containing protein [Candidatus Woesearchaeota archaeon]